MVRFISSRRIQKYKHFCINHNCAKNYFSFHTKKELNKFSVGNRFLMSIRTFFVKKKFFVFFLLFSICNNACYSTFNAPNKVLLHIFRTLYPFYISSEFFTQERETKKKIRKTFFAKKLIKMNHKISLTRFSYFFIFFSIFFNFKYFLDQL